MTEVEALAKRRLVRRTDLASCGAPLLRRLCRPVGWLGPGGGAGSCRLCRRGGRLRRRHYAKAYAEFLPLARGGDAAAQYSLGNTYRRGQGVARDDAEAVRWYRKAADQGNASAQYLLGVMYDGGRGVT